MQEGRRCHVRTDGSVVSVGDGSVMSRPAVPAPAFSPTVEVPTKRRRRRKWWSPLECVALCAVLTFGGIGGLFFITRGHSHRVEHEIHERRDAHALAGAFHSAHVVGSGAESFGLHLRGGGG
eukprot:Hpha_TRINITY_DN27539_c0_g1::TRINITY_DN27539_c0_g1_i1::g.86172::m.86172